MSEALLQDAQMAFQAGRMAEAAKLFHDVLRTNPRQFDALQALGMIYFHANEFEKSQYLIGEALKLDPLFLDGLCIRGVALVKLKRYDQGLACFERALSMKPDFVEALSNHGTTLLELGRIEEGLDEIERALAIDPTHAISWNNRGNALNKLKRYQEAVECYDRALSFYPDFPDARLNRLYALAELSRGQEGFAEVLCAQGADLIGRNQLADALAAFDEAIGADPDHVQALAGRATVLLSLNQPEEALRSFDAALAREPTHAISWNNRGNALAKLKRFEEAVQSYDRALVLQPGLPQAEENRENALFELKRGTRCPPGFMRHLFDDFASHYDDTMLNKLSYRAHLNLRELANRVLPVRERPWRVLDLGCGTGLVGEAFRGLAKGGRIDGIDLAPRMIEAARSRGVYDDLTLGDIESVLAAPGRSYDLILAADTMIYLGDLAMVFSGVTRRLEQGGFYLFAVEAMVGSGWEQSPMNRFRHSEAYLREEAARAGLEFVDMIERPLRREASQPVGGYAVALRKPLLQ